MNYIKTRDLQQYNPYSEFRSGQVTAINAIADLIESGQRVIELSAPTAAGKSLDVYVLLQYLAEECGFEYLTYTSPMVQLVSDQLRSQFPNLPVLVGKDNYRCNVDPTMSAGECPFSMAEEGFVQCAMCAYRIDYHTFIHSPYGATTLDRYMSDPSINARCEGLFIDESASTEDKLLGRVDMIIPADVNVNDLQNGLTIYYHNLVVEANQIAAKITELKEAIKARMTREGMAALKDLTRLYNQASREANKCARCLAFIEKKIPYIIDENRHFRLIEGKVLFDELISKLRFVVLASGTPTTSLLTHDYKSVTIPHPIDVNRRLVYYDPIAPGTNTTMVMNFKEREKWSPYMALKIARYHAKHASGRHTLVHCGTYGVAELIYNGFEKHAFARHTDAPMSLMQNVILQKRGAEGRERTMAEWRSNRDTILLAVDRNEGISCDGQEYPLNVIANIAFPPYKDSWIAARNAFDNKRWYNQSIAVDTMQACGRCTRGPEDFSTTVIMDGKFQFFYGKNRMLFQPWFREALRTGAP
jgi:Rad3-related DNA helicase